MSRIIELLRTDKDVHFTGAIAQNAGENEDIVTNYHAKECLLMSLSMIADQNLDYELHFWKDAQKTGVFGTADIDSDRYLGFFSFPASGAKQVGEAGISSYYYHQTLTSPFRLKDETTTTDRFNVHVRLMNRSATSKNAGATGEIVLCLHADLEVK
jgi:hypothetical protein